MIMNAVNAVHEWYDRYLLRLNPRKTVVSLILRNSKLLGFLTCFTTCPCVGLSVKEISVCILTQLYPSINMFLTLRMLPIEHWVSFPG